MEGTFGVQPNRGSCWSIWPERNVPQGISNSIYPHSFIHLFICFQPYKSIHEDYKNHTQRTETDKRKHRPVLLNTSKTQNYNDTISPKRVYYIVYLHMFTVYYWMKFFLHWIIILFLQMLFSLNHTFISHYVFCDNSWSWLGHFSVWTCMKSEKKLELTRMWANALPDGRPAEHRWRPLFNAANFCWRPLLVAVQ